MAAKVLPAPHSTSHSPIGSPRSSRTHVLHTSSGSQDTFTATTRSVKRKSWQTPDAPYVAQGWVDTTSSGHWEAVSSEDWGSGAAAADVTQMTGHRTLVPNSTTNIGHDDHLAPRVLDDGSHKYSPASSARNSVQSTSVTTPSLMGSMDSSNDIGGSTTAEGPHEQPYYYASPLQPIPAPSHNSSGYPQLTLQTNHLPQPQSPSGGYGPHYIHNPRSSYPPSRDYRYSYDQMSYTSPTMAVPPQTLFSPVLQHPHGVNHHDYFVRPQNQVFYADYVTSPTTAVPPSISGMYYAAQPQPIAWNQPITPSIGQVHSPVNTMSGFRRQNSQGQATLLNHPPQFQSSNSSLRGPAAPPGIQPNQFISHPNKLSSHLPSKSVPLPARGRSSAAARVQSTVNMGQQSARATSRHGRREQRDSAPLHRSSLLEDFRSNRNKRWELQEIQGHVAEFSSDQHGSRFIQHKLVTAPESTRSMVYREIIPSNVLRLARDVFGNYVLQKLCELGTPEERATIARTLQGHLVTLALDMYGCRVLQKMIDYLSAEDQSRWVAELSGHILQCVKDANGNHVIQKFLESPLSQHSVFITTFRGHVYELATHPYGCRVLQRCFEHVKPEMVRPLLNELHQRTLNLMQDQYGNYVMQFILEKGFMEDKNRVIQNITGHMLPMSKHKFASNVCEKAIISASMEQRRVLINEISLQRPDGMNPMITMIKDQYANYVLQRALTIAEGDALEGLLTALKPQLLNMRRYTANSPFTKHILAVEKILRDRDIDITSKEFHSPDNSNNSDSTTTPTMQVQPPGL